MNKIRIDAEYTLGVEPEGKGARFTLLKCGDAHVCRKVGKNEAKEIIGSDRKAFFAGRLKLHKRESEVGIEAKNKLVGSVPLKALQEELEKIFGGDIA